MTDVLVTGGRVVTQDAEWTIIEDGAVATDGSRIEAIGREDDLGSLEAGKQADLAIVDLDHPHLTPCPDPVSALVYNAQGFEIDTLLCAGEVVMAGRELRSFEQPLGEITERANETASAVLERAGLS